MFISIRFKIVCFRITTSLYFCGNYLYSNNLACIWRRGPWQSVMMSYFKQNILNKTKWPFYRSRNWSTYRLYYSHELGSCVSSYRGFVVLFVSPCSDESHFLVILFCNLFLALVLCIFVFISHAFFWKHFIFCYFLETCHCLSCIMNPVINWTSQES